MVAPPNCTLKHQSEILRLGDGWCDELAPYNTPGAGGRRVDSYDS
jgi:hypothetical protein